MHVDILIIGQGICGTLLHWNLTRQGYTSIVIDDNRKNTASRTAAGIINPVTGRRIVKTWMIDDLMPFAYKVYRELEHELDCKLIQSTDIIDFFSTPQMRESFYKRHHEAPAYLELPDKENLFNEYFYNDLGFGKISPSYLVMVDKLISSYRKNLLSAQSLREQKFEIKDLHHADNKWLYEDISATYIIFSDGIQSVRNPYFTMLPFAPNKGEVLYIQIEEKLPPHIFKKGINMVQLEEDNYWIGSTYEWNFTDDQPTTTFYEKTNAFLKQWLKLPFRIVDHRAAIRPATLERRPFVGFHPLHPTLGILNGMGTKGCTLAPWFAYELTKYIKYQAPINPEADILRFQKILSKT